MIWSLALSLMLVQDPAILQVHVLEGDGAVYGLGTRATRGITVQVTDETGKPIDGATVSFRLPDQGSSGAFSNGTHGEIAVTRPDGRAGVWGMQWNRTPGQFEIRITAVKGQTRAGTVCRQYLSDAAEKATPGSRIGPRNNHKWIWIGLAVAGAAGAGVAAAAMGAKPSATPTATPGVQIGTPSIVLGHP